MVILMIGRLEMIGLDHLMGDLVIESGADYHQEIDHLGQIGIADLHLLGTSGADPYTQGIIEKDLQLIDGETGHHLLVAFVTGNYNQKSLIALANHHFHPVMSFTDVGTEMIGQGICQKENETYIEIVRGDHL